MSIRHTVFSDSRGGEQEDLSANRTGDSFLGLVFEAVQSVDCPRHQQWEGGPRLLQTLLTYCYAVGIYGSREIELATSCDPRVRYICANRFPGADVIRRFRRQNKESVEKALACLIQLVSKERDQQRGFYADYSLRRWPGSGSLHSLPEAQRRLRKAIQADSMALDE